MGLLAKTPLGLRILAALAVGVAAGLLLPRPGAASWSDAAVHSAHLVGQLWLAALQMTVLPLVFALLTTGLSGPRSKRGGGILAKRAILVFAALYTVALTAAVFLNQFLLRLWPVSAAATEAFRRFAGPVEAKVPGAEEIILSVVPSNVFEALAAGSILPVVVFAILFGFGMRQVDKTRRTHLSSLIESFAAVMFRIVSWVLLLAPLGAFGLVLGTAHETGLGIVWGLAGYLRHILTVHFVMLALAYPVAVLWGRIALKRFSSAAASSQLIAVSTQSSVGSLPVMLESAKRIGISDEVANVGLPLAVSIFRFSGPPGTLTVAAYAAAAAGLQPSVPVLIGGAILALLMEFAAVGLPNQVNLFAINAPVFAALGAPLGSLAAMVAVETIPDAVGTTANVSMDLAATGVVNRLEGRPLARPAAVANEKVAFG